MAWTILLLLTALTRSFTLLLIPVFLVQMLVARGEKRHFARACLFASLGVLIVSQICIKTLTVNGFSPLEMTSLPNLIATHLWAWIDIRTFVTSTLQMALMALPALALCSPALWTRIRRVDVGVGAVGLLLGLYFWKKGLLTALLTLPTVPIADKILGLTQVLLIPVGLILASCLLRWAFAQSKSSTAQVAGAICLAQILVLPILSHPVLRHVFPAFLSLLLLGGLLGLRPGRNVLILAGITMAVCGGFNAWMTRHERMVNATEWQRSNDLARTGIPAQEIAGGWSWFCARLLTPGQAHPGNYADRFAQMNSDARYYIGPDPKEARGGRILESETIGSGLAKTTIYVIDRHPPTSVTQKGHSTRVAEGKR